MDLASLIANFATGTYAVTRRTRGVTVRGIVQDVPAAPFNVVACVQPATGKDLLRLPELRRGLETRTVFTSTLLRVGDKNTATEADLIVIDGDTWEVQHVETWHPTPNVTEPAYRCTVQRAQP